MKGGWCKNVAISCTPLLWHLRNEAWFGSLWNDIWPIMLAMLSGLDDCLHQTAGNCCVVNTKISHVKSVWLMVIIKAIGAKKWWPLMIDIMLLCHPGTFSAPNEDLCYAKMKKTSINHQERPIATLTPRMDVNFMCNKVCHILFLLHRSIMQPVVCSAYFQVPKGVNGSTLWATNDQSSLPIPQKVTHCSIKGIIISFDQL